MAPHSSTLAWKIPWAEEPGRLHPWGREKSDTTERLDFHFSLSCIGEGNGNPLQCSCLENPRDGGAWLAAVYGVARSWTRLMRLSSSSIPSPAPSGFVLTPCPLALNYPFFHPTHPSLFTWPFFLLCDSTPVKGKVLPHLGLPFGRQLPFLNQPDFLLLFTLI